ncbi:MAG TPA: DUF4221 family protein [Bacteroidales bacterium]|nr:DUF4221 family protein [Bacteroidales bacterium]HOR82161.1 DUF4221 family protein [Bacteroidales bacterium]HPJ91438.1 DUF4221 family protein [Bacteroidales bacterium]
MQNNYMLKNLGLLFLISVLFCSCLEKEKEIKYSFTQDTIVIAKSLQIKGFYEDKSGIYFYAKKYYCDSLFLYQEQNGHFEFHSFLNLPKSYLDSIKELNSAIDLAFINLDSVIAYTPQTIALLDLKNNALLKLFHHSQLDDTCVLLNRGGKLKWNPIRKTLPMMIICNDVSRRTWNYDTKFLGEFSLETGQVNILPLIYPYVEEYYGNKNYYSGTDPMITFKRDRYVVGFNTSPVIFTYTANNNKIDSFFIVNSNYKPLDEVDTTGLSNPSNYINFIIEGSTYQFYFEQLVYDEYKDVYYRFFAKDMPKKNKDGLLNTLKDKYYGLTVMDKNLKIIGDALWQGKKTNYWVPSSKGLLGMSSYDDKVIIIKLTLTYEK